jgi:hypothetical protein
MHRKKDESLSAFEVALASGKFRSPEELMERFGLEQNTFIFLRQWAIFTEMGHHDTSWLWTWLSNGFKTVPTAIALGRDPSAIRQRIARLKKAFKIAQKRRSPKQTS